jgi:hypothetical protein
MDEDLRRCVKDEVQQHRMVAAVTRKVDVRHAYSTKMFADSRTAKCLRGGVELRPCFNAVGRRLWHSNTSISGIHDEERQKSKLE